MEDFLASELFLRVTTPDSSVIGLQDSDTQLLPQFVQTAQKNVSPSLFPPLA